MRRGGWCLGLATVLALAGCGSKRGGGAADATVAPAPPDAAPVVLAVPAGLVLPPSLHRDAPGCWARAIVTVADVTVHLPPGFVTQGKVELSMHELGGLCRPAPPAAAPVPPDAAAPAAPTTDAAPPRSREEALRIVREGSPRLGGSPFAELEAAEGDGLGVGDQYAPVAAFDAATTPLVLADGALPVARLMSVLAGVPSGAWVRLGVTAPDGGAAEGVQAHALPIAVASPNTKLEARHQGRVAVRVRLDDAGLAVETPARVVRLADAAGLGAALAEAYAPPGAGAGAAGPDGGAPPAVLERDELVLVYDAGATSVLDLAAVLDACAGVGVKRVVALVPRLLGHGSGVTPGAVRPDGAGPNLAVGATAVTGPIDPEIARRFARRQLSAMLACYAREQARDATLAGTVVLGLVLGADGKVSEATASGVSPEVAECVRRRALGIVFPAPTGPGRVTVRQEFIFSVGLTR